MPAQNPANQLLLQALNEFVRKPDLPSVRLYGQEFNREVTLRKIISQIQDPTLKQRYQPLKDERLAQAILRDIEFNFHPELVRLFRGEEFLKTTPGEAAKQVGQTQEEEAKEKKEEKKPERKISMGGAPKPKLEANVPQVAPAPPTTPQRSFSSGLMAPPLKPQAPISIPSLPAKPVIIKAPDVIRPIKTSRSQQLINSVKRILRSKRTQTAEGYAAGQISRAQTASKRGLSRVPLSVKAAAIGLIGGLAIGGLEGGLLGAGAGFIAAKFISRPESKEGSGNFSSAVPPMTSFSSGLRPAPISNKKRRNIPNPMGANNLVRLAVRTGAMSNPWIWVGIAALVILAFLIIILGPILQLPPFQTGGTGTTTGDNRLTIKKTGTKPAGCISDCAVDNGENIGYEIEVTYTGVGKAEVGITDKVPDKTTFVSASDDGKLENGVVRWDLKDLEPGKAKKISFVIKPTENDIWVVNYAEGSINKIIGGGILPAGNSIIDLMIAAANSAGIPPAFLMAIGSTESQVMTYTDQEVPKFSNQGWWNGKTDSGPFSQLDPDIVRGYAYDTCDYTQCSAGADVRGAMQFELATWNGIANQVSAALGTSDPDRRNLTHNVYGSGILNKQHATDPVIGDNSTSNWSEDTVRKTARWYCAGKGAVNNPELVKTPACGWRKPGDLTYDDRVWISYQEFEAIY